MMPLSVFIVRAETNLEKGTRFMKYRLATYALTGLVAGLLSTAALAQTTDNDPGHPRINQVDQRLQNQNNRIQNGVQDGQMTPGQAKRDEKRDSRVEHQEQRDESKQGGHLTKGEQRHFNRELNRNSHDIHRQRHHGERRHWRHEHEHRQ